MRVSTSGLVVAATYAVLSVASVVWGYGLDGPKESTVLMQVPVLPAVIALVGLGLIEQAARLPLIVFYGAAIPIIALGLYAACWLFGALSARSRLVIASTVLVVLLVLTVWPGNR